MVALRFKSPSAQLDNRDLVIYEQNRFVPCRSGHLGFRGLFWILMGQGDIDLKRGAPVRFTGDNYPPIMVLDDSEYG